MPVAPTNQPIRSRRFRCSSALIITIITTIITAWWFVWVGLTRVIITIITTTTITIIITDVQQAGVLSGARLRPFRLSAWRSSENPALRA